MSGQRKTGTVEPLKSGRWSVRLSLPGGRRPRLPGTYATEAEARAACAVALDELGDDGEATLATIAEDFHASRELSGIRTAKDDGQSVWRTWIATAPFYKRPLRLHVERDVKKWAQSIQRQRADQTAKNALNLLRTAYEWARDEEYLHGPNPALNVRLARKGRTDDPWTYLTPAEIPGKLVELATEPEWDVISFAWGTGVRAGELRSLLLRDVHVKGVSEPHVIIRYGSPGKPTKSGRVRTVPLFGPALSAIQRWIDRLPTYCSDNDRGLAFPTARGGVRHEGHALGRVYLGRDKQGRTLYEDRFARLVRDAGLLDVDPARPLVWHSLRHTCASWCVTGWFGRRWSLEEVRELLGHQSVTTTERYAHLGETALRTAAREARSAGGSSSVAAISVHELSTLVESIANRSSFTAPPAGIGPATFGLGSLCATELQHALTVDRGQLVDTFRAATLAGDHGAAWTAAQALALGELAANRHPRLALAVLAAGPHAYARAVELAGAVDQLAAHPSTAETA